MFENLCFQSYVHNFENIICCSWKKKCYLYFWDTWLLFFPLMSQLILSIISGPLFSQFNDNVGGKGPDAGKDWGQEEKREAEDEMVGWHHCLNGQTWAWASSGRWWWTGKPGVLQSMGSQRVRHDGVNEQWQISVKGLGNGRSYCTYKW